MKEKGRIQNLHERDSDQRDTREKKKRGFTIYTKVTGDLQYTREIVKEKSKSVKKGIQEHSKRRFFKANFSTLIKSSVKAFKKSSIKVHLLLKHSFNSSSTLRKSKRELDRKSVV